MACCVICNEPNAIPSDRSQEQLSATQTSEDENELLLETYLRSLTLPFTTRHDPQSYQSLVELGPMAIDHLSRTDDVQALDRLMRQVVSFLCVPDVFNACEVAQLCLRIMKHGGDPEPCARGTVNRLQEQIARLRQVLDTLPFANITLLLSIRDRLIAHGHIPPPNEWLQVVWEELGRPEKIAPKLSDDHQLFLSVSLLSYPLMRMLEDCSEFCQELRSAESYKADIEWIVGMDSGLRPLIIGE